MRTLIILMLLLFSSLSLFSLTTSELISQINNSKVGDTINIPAGVYEFDKELSLTKSITLKGEGHDKVTLVFKSENGITAAGRISVNISDLSIMGAKNCGIKVSNIVDSEIARVKVTGSLNGISASNSSVLTISSSVFYGCKSGATINNSNKFALLNCTFYNNDIMALSLNNSMGAVCNNIFSNNAMAIYINSNAYSNPAAYFIDYNLYFGTVIGKARDSAISSLDSWRSLEGYDYHSTYSAIEFKNPSKGDFTPVTYQFWRPLLVSQGFSSDINTLRKAYKKNPMYVNTVGENVEMPELKDVSLDINGNKIVDTVGAVMAVSDIVSPRPADGKFTVSADEGYKSAGLYDNKGQNILWLFDLLPLRRGEYEFWIPSHDTRGNQIPAGNYILKVSEANLSLKYIDTLGNNPQAPKEPTTYGSAYAYKAIFAFYGQQLAVFNNSSESQIQVRDMNYNMSQELWNIPGSQEMFGVCGANYRNIYMLKAANENEYMLQRIGRRGVLEVFSNGEYGISINRQDVGEINGICYFFDNAYQEKLFMASPSHDKLYNAFNTNETIAVKNPKSPVADMAREIIWLISGDKTILVIDFNGEEISRIELDFDICSLSVNGNFVAVSSISLGQVIVYDITNFDSPVEITRLGTGDGPYGKIEPERFEFKNINKEQVKRGVGNIDISASGDLLVNDNRGIKLFNYNGELTKDFTGVLAEDIDVVKPLNDEYDIEILDKTYNVSMLYSEKTNQKSPGYYYQKSEEQFSIAAKTIAGFSYSMDADTCQVEVRSNDGLLLGILGTPTELFWLGRRLDNRSQFNVAKSESGTHYVVMGNAGNSAIWLNRVENTGAVSVLEYPVVITEGMENSNKASDPQKNMLERNADVESSPIVIKKLNTPITFTGQQSLLAWRELLPTPQIFLTPELVVNTAGQKIGNISDISGLMRLAYNVEGATPYLYGQLLTFDDIVTHHQPISHVYEHDALELIINSYITGIKLNITKTTDKGDIILRDGWSTGSFELDAISAPRLITVLQNGLEVSERKLLEDIYGVNLQNTRVIITEFKIPLTNDVFKGHEDELPIVKSGETFRLGVALSDNDIPGTDAKKMIVMPFFYNDTAHKDAGAIAVFE